MRHDLFKILEIEPTDDFSVVKRAYRKKARELQSGKNPGDSTAKEAFQQLQAAVEKVGDPEKLSHYFETLLNPSRTKYMTEHDKKIAERRKREEYQENEGDRINALYKANFPADPTKTGFVDIYVPLYFITVDSTEIAKGFTPGLYFAEDCIDADIILGRALPLPTEIKTAGPQRAKYNPDDLIEYRRTGINFDNVADALTKLSNKRHLQVGCSAEEAYGIITQWGNVYYRPMIIQVSVPAQSLSAQPESDAACINQVGSSDDIKTLLLRKKNIVKADQIEKAIFGSDDGYPLDCSIWIDDPCEHRNIFETGFLGNTDALNPSYVNPSQERPRSPTRTTASLFSSAAASSDAKPEDASVTPKSSKQ